MAKTCNIENMDIDGSVVGQIFMTEEGNFIPTSWREIHVVNIYCGDCGSDITTDSTSFNADIKEHLEEA